MHSSITLLVAALAGSSVAMPWKVDFAPTGQPTAASVPDQSGNPGGPMDTSVSPVNPPVGTSVSPVVPPAGNTTTTTTTSLPAGGITTTYSTTETIIKTIFVPCSSPIALPGGSTVYSSWLTSSVYTTTTCYPVTTVEPVAPTTAPAPVITTCPAPPPPQTITVTITTTVLPPGVSIYYPPTAAPHPCEECQTIIYTDIYSTVTSIVMPAPTEPVSPPPAVSVTTSTASQPTSPPATPPYGTGSSSIPRGTGTGSNPLPQGTGTAVPLRRAPHPAAW